MTTRTVLSRFLFRRDTAANWTAENPVLLADEPGWESDTGKYKFGNGVDQWSDLPYQEPLYEVGNGFVVKTASGFAQRSIAAGSSKIAITNGDGQSGNPTIDLGSVSASDLSNGVTGSGAVVLAQSPEFSGSTRFGHIWPSADNTSICGNAALRWSTIYAASGIVDTSDERVKRDIEPLPDAWLDAWSDVEWQRFRFVDGRRWHVGLIAQHVHRVFAEHGLDAFELGLCCFDEWEERREPLIKKDGEVSKRSRVAVRAGNRWGLRYSECFALEAALQRRTAQMQDKKMDEIKRMLERVLDNQG